MEDKNGGREGATLIKISILASLMGMLHEGLSTTGHPVSLSDWLPLRFGISCPAIFIENYHTFKENFAKKKNLKVLLLKLETETFKLWNIVY